MNRILITLFACLALQASVHGVTIGTPVLSTHWDVNWLPLMGLNDAFDSTATTEARKYDFVGNPDNPGAYFASTADYIYFRMRVGYAGVVDTSTFRGTHFVMIDNNPSNGTQPDFAFAWDSASYNFEAQHGLEMCKYNTSSNGNWGGTKMTDVDGGTGIGNEKGIMDINGDIANRGWDGYLRTVDSIASVGTVNLGNTTFIDISVKWAYLAGGTSGFSTTTLDKGQTWNITFASISGGNDHSLINADVAGNASLTSSNTVGFITIPEPSIAHILSIAGALALLTTRRRSRQ